MKKSKFDFYFYITFLAYCLWGYFLRNVIFCGNNIESKLIIYYSGFVAFIVVIINKISKNLIYNCLKSKNEKRFKIVLKSKDEEKIKVYMINVIILVLICGFIILGESYINNCGWESEWIDNRYSEIFSIAELKDFVIYILLLNNGKASFIVLLNTIIVLIEIILLISYNYGIGKNFIENFIHYYFKYNYIIVFAGVILISTKTYLYTNILSYIIIFCCVIGIITLLTLRFKYKSTLKKEGEKLIIVVNESNFEFNMLKKENVYKQFSNYRTKNLLNMYALENDQFTLIDYQLVRNGLINIRKYKTITFLLMFKASNLNLLNKSTVENLKTFVSKLNSIENNFMIAAVKDEPCTVLDEFKEKYRENYQENLSVRKIINKLVVLENNVELEQILNIMKQEYDNIGNQTSESYKFIIKTIKNIDTLDSTKTFYDLMKLCEYIIQYRALKNICNSENDTINREDLVNTSLGKWQSYQGNIELKVSNEVVESMQSIKQKLKLDDKVSNNYESVCAFIVSLRNKLIGHGNITYSVSKVIVKDFAVIAHVLIKQFMIDDITLDEKDVIKNVFEEDKSSFINGENINKEKDTYLYNFAKGSGKKMMFEYLNYENGKIIKENSNYKIQLNMKIGEIQ